MIKIAAVLISMGTWIHTCFYWITSTFPDDKPNEQNSWGHPCCQGGHLILYLGHHGFGDASWIRLRLTTSEYIEVHCTTCAHYTDILIVFQF